MRIRSCQATRCEHNREGRCILPAVDIGVNGNCELYTPAEAPVPEPPIGGRTPLQPPPVRSRLAV